MPLPTTYSTGTISIAHNATVAVGTGTFWSPLTGSVNVLFIDGVAPIFVDAVTDDTHLAIPQYTGTTLTNVTYRLAAFSAPSLQASADLVDLRAKLNAVGVFHYVEGDAPDPSFGNDGDYAIKINTGLWKQWFKDAGVWLLQGTPIGATNRGVWSAVTNYAINDIVTRLGTVYLSNTANLNRPPESNPADWSVLGAKGDKGDDGVEGPAPAIVGTSTSVIAIPAPESIGFTTQEGLAFAVGQKLNAVNSDFSRTIVGMLTDYTDDLLSINVEFESGTGTDHNWTITIAGERGPRGLTGPDGELPTLPITDGKRPLVISGSRALMYEREGRVGFTGLLDTPPLDRLPVTHGVSLSRVGAAGELIVGVFEGASYSPGSVNAPKARIGSGLGYPQVFVVGVDSETSAQVETQVTFAQHDDLELPEIVDGNTARFYGPDADFPLGAVKWRSLGTPEASGYLDIIIMHGQSNAVASNDDGELITAVPPMPGRVLCFNGGVLPHQLGGDAAAVSVAIDAARYASVVDAAEGLPASWMWAETATTAIAEVVEGPLGFNGANKALVFNAAVNGQPFDALVGYAVESVCWENVKTLVQAATDYAAANDLIPRVLCFAWWDGEYEVGSNTSAGTYGAYLTALRTRLAGLEAITGQAWKIQLALCGMAKPRYDGTMGGPTLALELSSHQPNTFYCPVYWLTPDMTGQYHHTSRSHRHLGEYIGVRLAERIAGAKDTHLFCLSASRVGRIVRAIFNRADIVFDAAHVTDPGDFGFKYQDSGGVIGINTVALQGDTVTLELASTPTGTGELLKIASENATLVAPGEYGIGYLTGQRSCLRTRAAFYSQTTGRPLWTWAAHQHVVVSH